MKLRAFKPLMDISCSGSKTQFHRLHFFRSLHLVTFLFALTKQLLEYLPETTFLRCLQTPEQPHIPMWVQIVYTFLDSYHSFVFPPAESK